MTIVAPTYFPTQNKVLESYSGTFDDLLATVSNDSDDQMFFPLDDLEDDLPIITDPNQKLTVNGCSPNFDRLGLKYWPSVSPPSASSHVRMFSNTSSRLDLTNPCTTWLKRELSIDSSAARVTNINTNIGPSLLEDSDNASRLASVAKKHTLFGKHDAIAAQFSSQPGETSHKTDFPSTRHKHWTRKEDEILRHAMAEEGNGKIVWCKISELYFRATRSAAQCKVRWNNVSFAFYILTYHGTDLLLRFGFEHKKELTLLYYPFVVRLPILSMFNPVSFVGSGVSTRTRLFSKWSWRDAHGKNWQIFYLVERTKAFVTAM